MQDPTARITAILTQYARDLGFPVASWTRFSELGIDRLDLPMIVLDIEDAFAIQIRYDEEMDGFTSVGDLIACVQGAPADQAHALPLRPTLQAPLDVEGGVRFGVSSPSCAGVPPSRMSGCRSLLHPMTYRGERSRMDSDRTHPFTHTICRSVCSTSTRSVCAAITASMSL